MERASEKFVNTFLKFKRLEKQGVILCFLVTGFSSNLNACNDYTIFEHGGTENGLKCQRLF